MSSFASPPTRHVTFTHSYPLSIGSVHPQPSIYSFRSDNTLRTRISSNSSFLFLFIVTRQSLHHRLHSSHSCRPHTRAWEQHSRSLSHLRFRFFLMTLHSLDSSIQPTTPSNLTYALLPRTDSRPNPHLTIRGQLKQIGFSAK